MSSIHLQIHILLLKHFIFIPSKVHADFIYLCKKYFLLGDKLFHEAKINFITVFHMAIDIHTTLLFLLYYCLSFTFLWQSNREMSRFLKNKSKENIETWFVSLCLVSTNTFFIINYLPYKCLYFPKMVSM